MRKLCVVLTLALPVLAAAPAQANEPAAIVRFPVTGGTFINPCTAEPVTIVKGTFQIVSHGTLDAGGGFHGIAEGNAQGVEAVSPSGRYRVTGGFWSEFNTGPERATVETVTNVFNLISQGSTDNLAVETAAHVTFNANGEPTAIHFSQADGTCRG